MSLCPTLGAKDTATATTTTTTTTTTTKQYVYALLRIKMI
jgi:hypothetical protein